MPPTTGPLLACSCQAPPITILLGAVDGARPPPPPHERSQLVRPSAAHIEGEDCRCVDVLVSADEDQAVERWEHDKATGASMRGGGTRCGGGGRPRRRTGPVRWNATCSACSCSRPQPVLANASPYWSLSWFNKPDIYCTCYA
jgi:hypothetical protein